jgi:hypothetical protein
MPATFQSHVLAPIQKHTGHKIKAPRRQGLEWGYDEGPDFREVQLTIDASLLSTKLRADGPASPMFALCLAAALDGTPGAPVRAAVEVVGDVPPEPGLGYKTSKELLLFRRSAFLLHTLVELLPERFILTADDRAHWSWPKWSWFSVEGGRKNKPRPPGGPGRVAFEMEVSPRLYAEFGEGMEPIRRFQGNLPVVVHTTEVSKESHYTVGGRTAIPFWVASQDGRRVHLFDLETGKKPTVGGLAEALCNAAMLEHVFDGNGHFDTNKAVGLAAVRQARRMVMWMFADEYHPLVFDEKAGDSTVLRWLNGALARRSFRFGVLPWTGEASNPQISFDARWGGGF